MIEHGLVHQRQAHQQGHPFTLDGVEHGGGFESAHHNHRAAARQHTAHQRVLGAMKEGQHGNVHGIAPHPQLKRVVHRCHHHRQMALHHPLRAAGGSAGVHDLGYVAVMNFNLGLSGRLRSNRCSEAAESPSPLAFQHPSATGLRLDGCTQLRAHQQSGIHKQEARLRVVDDVANVIQPQAGVDRHPDQAGAMDAEHGHQQLKRVIA